MAKKVLPHLMFDGRAEEAMNCYVSLFPGSAILQMDKYGKGEAGPEGTVKLATFRLAGQHFLCIDSPVVHDFSFTPASSIFVDCENEAEINAVWKKLAEDGEVLMPLGGTGFSKRFGWLKDRYGLSWQLNLPE